MKLRWIHSVALAAALTACGEETSGENGDPRVAAIMGLTGDAASGAEIYERECASSCHLPDGTGEDGGGLGKNLVTWLERNELEDAALAILDGRPPFMPGYGRALSAQEVAGVLAYLPESFGAR